MGRNRVCGSRYTERRRESRLWRKDGRVGSESGRVALMDDLADGVGFGMDCLLRCPRLLSVSINSDARGTYDADIAEDLEDWKAYSEFKRWKSFRGVHHWHPWKLPNHSTDPAEAKRVHRIRSEMWYERYCTYWFDLRRIGACALSIAAFALHIGLLVE